MTMEHQIGQEHTDIQPAPHQTKRGKYATLFMYASLILSAIITAILLLWLFQSTDVLIVKNNPVPVRTIRKHPTADGVIILKVDFCKRSGAVGRVRTSFVSESREVFLPVGEDKQGPTCEVREVPILIPHETPPDMYRIKFRIDYKINPLKNSVEEFESLPFEVKR